VIPKRVRLTTRFSGQGTSTRPAKGRSRRRRGLFAGVIGLSAAVALMAGLAVSSSSAWYHPVDHQAPTDGLGIQPGKIKHVWLIILENKSYDATFTGLNDNTYLWKTLPSQGALLKNYYGTGHDSLDNYLSMASGQAPLTDTQTTVPTTTAITGLDRLLGQPRQQPQLRAARLRGRPERGPGSERLRLSQLGADAVQPARRRRRELEGLRAGPRQPGRRAPPTHDAGTQYCGAPVRVSGPTDGAARHQPNPGSANATDQYVPKHFPFPWFESILQSGDCNAAHIANLFSRATASTTTCRARAPPRRSAGSLRTTALTGTTPCATATTSRADSPTPPRPTRRLNYTGGLYAADLFLEHVIPEIEASPAYKDGGLIDVTFDEAFPPFTYTGNSFANSKDQAPELLELADLRQRRRDAVRRGRGLRADRPERPAADQRPGR
jgi:hypothetical protein